MAGLYPNVGAEHSLDYGGANYSQVGRVVYTVDSLRTPCPKAQPHKLDVVRAQWPAIGRFKAHLFEVDIVSFGVG